MENKIKPIKVYRLRYVFELRNGYTPSKKDLSYWSGGTIPWFRMEDIRKNGRILSDSIQHITSKAVKGGGLFSANSFILATTATIGEHALLIADSLANQQFTNLKVRKSLMDKFDMKFLFYYMYKIGEWCKNSVNTTCFSSVNIDELKSQMIPLFTLSDQKAIAEYLDKATAEIDKAIAQQQHMIDLLNERKQIIIQRAVTKGLDENVEMKDSGLNWLGQIPSHWELVRLGYSSWIRARLGWRGLKANEYVENGYVFLSAFNIVNNRMRWEGVNYINKFRYEESPEIKLNIGDILLVKDGAGIGKCARIDELPLGEATANGSLAFITPNPSLDYRFLHYFIICDSFKKYTELLLTGMGVPHFTQGAMKKVKVPIPPIEEQKRIILHLDQEVDEFDIAIGRLEKQISLLQERKQIIISEVVTGKVKVS